LTQQQRTTPTNHMKVRNGHLRRRTRANALRLLTACVAFLGLGCCMPVNFIQGPSCTIQQHHTTAHKTQVHFFSSGASPPASSASAEQAYSAFVSKYPKAAESGKFLGASCSKSEVLERFRSLSQSVGDTVAVDIVSKEPIVLLQPSAFVRSAFEYLKSLETTDEQGLAMETVQKNPKLLTIPEYEFKRTNPSLQSLAMSASAIDFLRPLGEGGIALAIFGSFIVLLIILRPILFGVKGQQSLVGMLFDPVFTAFPVLKSFSPASFREWLEGYGISLPALVALIPIYQVVSSIKSKIGSEKQQGS